MSMESLLEEKGQRKRKVTLEEHARNRQKARKHPTHFYLGIDLETGDSIFLPEEIRTQHIHLLGGTGSGKTSFIESMIFHDLERGRGLVFIDGKGDIGTLRTIYGFAKFLGREKDFRFFSLPHPELSNTYSPLTNGSASQVKDKLIGSVVWSEPYYKKTSEDAIQILMRAIFETGMRCTFQDLSQLLRSKNSVNVLFKWLKPGIAREMLEEYQKDYDKNLKEIRGFSKDINLLVNSEFGELFNSVNPEIDFIRAYEQDEIIYVQLNKRGFGEMGVRIGKLILKDLAFTSDHFDTQLIPSERKLFPCYIEEFDALLFDYFSDFAVQGRSSGFALTLANHSLTGDLRPDFRNKLLDNVNLNIFMRQRANESVEACANVSGTRKAASESYQTEEKNEFFSKKKALTGFGNVYIENQYYVDPNLIRNLQTGEAYCVGSEPQLRAWMKLNYMPPVPWEGDFQKIEVTAPDRFTRIPLTPEIHAVKVRRSPPSS